MLPAIVALVVLGATPAEQREARALAKRSVREWNVAQFEEALADVQRAYLLDPQPDLLFNVGQCEKALHHWELARFAFARYLREKPQASDRAKVQGLIAEMEAATQREGTAAPQPTPAPPVEAHPPPREVAAPVAVPSVAAPPSPPPEVAPAPPAVPPAAVQPSVTTEAPKPHRSHTLAWTLGSIGVAAGIVAVVGAVALDLDDQTISSANANPRTQPASHVTPAFQQAQVWQPVSIALGIVGVLGVAGGILTW